MAHVSTCIFFFINLSRGLIKTKICILNIQLNNSESGHYNWINTPSTELLQTVYWFFSWKFGVLIEKFEQVVQNIQSVKLRVQCFKWCWQIIKKITIIYMWRLVQCMPYFRILPDPWCHLVSQIPMNIHFIHFLKYLFITLFLYLNQYFLRGLYQFEWGNC